MGLSLFLKGCAGSLQRAYLFAADLATYLYFLCSRHKALDFVSMGLGIQARFKRHNREWQAHLEHTKQFVAENIADLGPGETVAVLGAGRLYDFPLKSVCAQRLAVDLYDYDPSLKREWRRIQAGAHCLRHFYFDDLTGVLELWSQELRSYSGERTPGNVGAFLRSLPQRHPPHYDLPQGYGCVVSLNILSQLGLYWRDRAGGTLARMGITSEDDGSYADTIEDAFRECNAALERAHLESIERSRPAAAVVICDRSYLFYTNDNSGWSEQPALTMSPALERYQAVKESGWFWHIAPMSRERIGFGEIHEVTAFAYQPIKRAGYARDASDAAPVTAA